MTFLQYELELRYRLDPPSERSAGWRSSVRDWCISTGPRRESARFSAQETVAGLRRQGASHQSLYFDGERGVKADPSCHCTQTAWRVWAAAAHVVFPPRTCRAPCCRRSTMPPSTERWCWPVKKWRDGRNSRLEPSALRAPDAFTAPRSMGPSGAHLPATLHDLAQAAQRITPAESGRLCPRREQALRTGRERARDYRGRRRQATASEYRDDGPPGHERARRGRVVRRHTAVSRPHRHGIRSREQAASVPGRTRERDASAPNLGRD